MMQSRGKTQVRARQRLEGTTNCDQTSRQANFLLGF